jgi:hypothetical protein
LRLPTPRSGLLLVVGPGVVLVHSKYAISKHLKQAGRIERIDRIGLELGMQGSSEFHVEEDDPLSAVVVLRWTETMSRDDWQIRIETWMRLSCTRDVFLLQVSLRAWEGAEEVCRREWDRSIPHSPRLRLTIQFKSASQRAQAGSREIQDRASGSHRSLTTGLAIVLPVLACS